MFEVSVTQSFAAAHALRGYHGKCENLHGHNYRVEVIVAGEKLDATGLLADFVEIKAAMKQVIDRFDHTNLNETPPFDTVNPSAENIAEHLTNEVQKLLGPATQVAAVKVWETDTCVATYRPGPGPANSNTFDFSDYFRMVGSADSAWNEFIDPVLAPHAAELSYRCVLDLACGQGRHGEILRKRAERIICVDANPAYIEICRKRFHGDARFRFVVNDGRTLAGVESGEVTLLVTFDSMVHFSPDSVKSYLQETARVLAPGGFGFFHHSNYTGNREGDARQSPHWRAYMSRELFAGIGGEAGLAVVSQRVIDWGGGKDLVRELDCLTLVRKPR